MYKPPQNSNRVKSIKSKFENIENNNKTGASVNTPLKNGARCNLNNSKPCKEKNGPVNPKQLLTRQHSDPCKIKRTPAFRLEKNVATVTVEPSNFQRNSFTNKSALFENKVKQFSALKSSCDAISNNNVNREPLNNVSNNQKVRDKKSRPILLKSKSSHDFALIRSRFAQGESTPFQRNGNNVTNQRSYENGDSPNLLDLYTEPIPKSLRGKAESPPPDIYHSSTLKLSDIKAVIVSPNESTNPLTDTLKIALKRPLPSGPAPKKPPRTFQHPINGSSNAQPDSIDVLSKNTSFLHLSKTNDKKWTTKQNQHKPKADPKYMLNKLENALRNNKLRSRRKASSDFVVTTTSGEDSDDSLLFRSKANNNNRVLPKLPNNKIAVTTNNNIYNESTSPFSNFSNFNCLQSVNCISNSSSPYERIKEPCSTFFVPTKNLKEPVYAEPFNFESGGVSVLERQQRNGEERVKDRNIRNSLYYMSTPVVTCNDKMESCEITLAKKIDDRHVQDFNLNMTNSDRLNSEENSSLSSFTSDLDLTPSPMEENTLKCIIESFEASNHNTTNKCCTIPKEVTQFNDRVETLKNHLQETLDSSFKENFENKRGYKCENSEVKVADIISKFQTYIKSVPKYCQPKVHNKDTLFYCCFIVERVKKITQIKFKYPCYVQIPDNIEILCFPENDDVLLDSSNNCYSLSITNDKGERTYGYCRRVVPEGSPSCLPLAYCILSKYKAPRFYQKVLKELESRHGIRVKLRDELVKQFYNQKFPKPGQSVKIDLRNFSEYEIDNKAAVLEDSLDLTSYVHVSKRGEYSRGKTDYNVYVCEQDLERSSVSPSLIVQNGNNVELFVTLHHDSLYEDSDLIRLHKLHPDIILKIFSSLLLERKVILISTVISNLSACVESVQSLLHPFIWCHTYIPVLPNTLWDIVESPTPLICGVLSPDVINDHQIENGIVVDIDSGKVLVEEGDEMKIMSSSMQKEWRKSLAIIKNYDIDYVRYAMLRQAYLQVFRLIFRNFKNYIQDGKFDKTEFINNARTKGIKQFLKMFTETNMFMAYVDGILNDPDYNMNFDRFNVTDPENYNKFIDKLNEWKKS